LRKLISRLLIIAPISLGSSGCFLPAAGPESIDVRSPTYRTLPYLLVKITPSVVDGLKRTEPDRLAGTAFGESRRPSEIVFGVGDVVSVTIFEAQAGGLYIPAQAGIRPGNFVTMPDQVVDNNGNISVPYAGAIRASGKTNVQIQDEIIARIKNRAIDPQVIVTATQQRSSFVSVMGEVNAPVRYPSFLAGAQDRITDALTRAGGIKGQGYETWVILERGKRRVTIPFENLIMDARNNVYIQPGDRIYVYREQQKFIALGAVGAAALTENEYDFNAWRINLAEGVARAGGLRDEQADPDSVFLYRREPKAVAAGLGYDVSSFAGDTVPVIFTISFKDPGGFFLATQVEMRNGDVIYVANAPSVEIGKFLQFVNLAVGTGSNVALGIQYGVGAKNALTSTGSGSVVVPSAPTTTTSTTP
jgi:polysaccharide biosynthesis/export protein